ncbi:MAG: 5-(carboxyamino)imidazole ribonucleotide synthase [Acidimicrobiia bacterium]
MTGDLIAVLGGGQLGRMIGLAGLPLGVEFRFLDPAAQPPAQVAGPTITAPLDDLAAVDRLVDGARVCTYEWEGVPAATAEHVAQSVPVFPDARALEVASDRIAEKTLLRDLGIGVAPFAPVDDDASLQTAVTEIGLPAVLKTRRGGYDGKGQVVLQSPADVDRAFDAIGGVPAILEGFVPFEREVSVIAVRGRDGDVRVWPLVENVHRNGILRESVAPAPNRGALQSQAEAHITKLLDTLAYVGVITLECFVLDGELLGNEIAPRVHNSGHWTIEGAVTSQFENHVRAIAGIPLGATHARGMSVMFNAIGALPDRDAVLAIPGAHFHDYGKEPRHARKVGHITVTADERVALDAACSAVRTLIAASEDG